MIEQLTVDQAILNCFSYYSKLHKINYIRPSEATIQRFIHSRFKYKRSITTISRHINKLARLGYFEIQRRNPIFKDGVLHYQSNLYYLKDLVFKSVYFIMKSSESALKGLSRFYKHTRAKVLRPNKSPPDTTRSHKGVHRKHRSKGDDTEPQRLLHREPPPPKPIGLAAHDSAFNDHCDKMSILNKHFPNASKHEFLDFLEQLMKKHNTSDFRKALRLEGLPDF